MEREMVVNFQAYTISYIQLCNHHHQLGQRIQYAPPPWTAPLVEMAQMDRIVKEMMKYATPSIRKP